MSEQSSGSPEVIIDAHHHVGVAGQPTFDDDWARRDLEIRRADLQRMGIDKCIALPSPGGAAGFRNVDHAAMNDAMLRYARLGEDIVEAVAATVNPVEVSPACRELERAVTTLGMRAVSFHHRFLGIPINDRRMDEVLQVAAELRCTVLVHVIADSTLEASWRLFALARRFPTIRFLALDGFSSANQASMIREQAPDHPNVWFDTGAMVSVAHGLRAFIDGCGAERLVFGTDNYSGGGLFRQPYPLLELSAMGLTAEQQDRIFHKNIRLLFSAP